MRKNFLLMLLAIIICKFLFIDFTNIYGQIQSGDRLKLWTSTNIDYEPLINEPQYLVDVVCQKVGKHCYIFFADGATLPSQSLIDSITNVFDNIYYPQLTTAFGPVPDEFDNDSNIIILFLDTVKWGGFFDPAQLMPDTMIYNRWHKHSSEREILYINSIILEYGAKYFSVIAHELIHMITWKYDHSPEPVNNPEKYWEDSWINEAWAGFGTGYFKYDFIPWGPDIEYINYPKLSFYTSYMNDPLLFLNYLFDQYGEWDFIKTLLKNQRNGTEGIEHTLNELGYNKSFDDFFEDFVIANYINDTNYADGIYSYNSINVISCFKSPEKICTDAKLGLYEGQLASYAKEYFLFNLQTQDPFPIEFYGDENSEFRLVFISTNNDGDVLEIKSVMPDDLNKVVLTKDSVTVGSDILIMIVINTDDSLGDDELVPFSYKTLNPSVICDKSKYNEVSVFPNPVSQNFIINFPDHYGSTKLELYDIQGRKIFSKTIINNESINSQRLIKGVYFYKIISDQIIQSGKLIKE